MIRQILATCMLTLLLWVGETQSAIIKLVQSGTTSIATGGTVSVAVTDVDMSASFLVFQSRHDSNRPAGATVRGVLAANNKIDFTRVSDKNSDLFIQWYLVEFSSGVIVQRGDVTQGSTESNIGLAALSDINNAFVLLSKTVKSNDKDFSENEPIEASLTSTTNLRLTAGQSVNEDTIHWQVVEFTDGSVNVQRGESSFTAIGIDTQSEVIGNSVDPLTTMLLTSWSTSGSGNDIDSRMIRARIENINSVEFKRETGGDDEVFISYEVVEFNDGTLVQEGALTFSAGVQSQTISIDAIDTGRSIALSTVQGFSGQSLGTSARNDKDVVGEGAFTFTLESPTSLKVERMASAQSSTVQWQVVQFYSPNNIASNLTACQQSFPDGLSANDLSATVVFKKNGVLIDNPDSLLAMGAIATNHGASCDSSSCVASGILPLESLTIPPYQVSVGGGNVQVVQDTTLGNDGTNTFNGIEIDAGLTLSFSSQFSVYKIATIKLLGNDVTLNLLPGDYFIGEFNFNNKRRLKINVIGAGTARIWSQNDIIFKDGMLINSPAIGVSGMASKLFTHTLARFHAEKDSTISAVIIGEQGFKVKGTASVFGAGQGGGNLELNNDGSVTYQPDQILAMDFNNACDNSLYLPLDHFSVIHDRRGISCLAEPISVIAKLDDNFAYTDFTGKIFLDTQSGSGTWSLLAGSGLLSDNIADDGLASYIYSEADNGEAQFYLSYPEGPSPIDIDAYLSLNLLVRDDDTEGVLGFYPSGLVLTESALPASPPPTINDPITTKVAGTIFNIHLAAFGETPTDTQCGVIEAYTGDKPINFWAEYNDPVSGTLVPLVDGVPIANSEMTASPQTVTFLSGLAVVGVKYKDVGRIRLGATDVVTALAEDDITGATNLFVSKPADLVITEVSTAAGVVNPGASSSTGTRFVKAGESFHVTVEVVDAEGTLTPNYGKEQGPELVTVVASSLVIPVGGSNGSENNGAITNPTNFIATGPAGRFINESTSWDEFGVVRLQASIGDGQYLGVGDVVGTESGNVGRFYVADFDVVNSSVIAACNGFSYMDAPDIAVGYTVHARGVAGNILHNYDFVLLGGMVATPVWTAENNNLGDDLGSRLNITASTWSNGIYSRVVSDGSFARLLSPAGPDGPFNDLLIGLAMVSADAVPMINADMNAADSLDCVVNDNCDARMLGSAISIRYGRLEVLPSFGIETAPLGVRLKTRYFDSEFVTSDLDNCTSYIRDSASLSNYTGDLSGLTVIAPISSEQLLGGETLPQNAIQISAPGAGNTGSVDLTYDAPSWLEFDWTGTGNTDPMGTALFGHFRGHDRMTYWREMNQ